MNENSFPLGRDNGLVRFDEVMAELDALRHRIEHLEAMHNAVQVPTVAPRRAQLFDRLLLRERMGLLQGSVIRHGGVRSVVGKAKNVLVREGVQGLVMRVLANLFPDNASDGFADHEHSPSRYVNEVVPRRAAVLGSAWHVGLIRSRTETPDFASLPALTISAVTFNSERWLPGFLASLKDQDYPLAALDLVFADNGSSDGTITLLQDFAGRHSGDFRSVRIIERTNDGFGAGHNAVISAASTDLVLVTNVDLLFGRDSIVRAVMAAVADDPQVATWELAQAPYEHPKYYDPVTLETPWCAHACVLMRRTAFDEVGGYDDHIFMYGEDVELSYRFRGAGYLLRYLPWVQVTHFVDPGDTTARPRQLGGSLAASVLLRYRYATKDAAVAAERQLMKLARQERDPDRRAGFAEAIGTIRRERLHFMQNRRPVHAVTFPFDSFDYIIRRDGHDVPVAGFGQLGTLPLASIVTRTHGPRTAVLGEAIATVLNQTYPRIEHVIVEDRTDHARHLVETAAVAYGRVLRYVGSAGPGRSAAGNDGMAAAEGEVLVLLDNDDLLFADHIATLMSPLIADPELVAAYSLAWEVQIAPHGDGYAEFMHTLHPQFRLKYSRARLRRANFIPIQAIAFRKALFDRAGGFEEDLEALEDWSLWNSYARFGNFELVPRLTSLYHTPLDPEVRAQRQDVLDKAYEPVRALIAAKYR